MTEAPTISKLTQTDWPRVREIYQEGIDTGEATFAQDVPSWEEWDRSHLDACRFVARHRGRISGWVALSPVSTREVYAGVAEVSIYVSAESTGQGIGSMLLGTLIESSEDHGFWTLQAGIFPENKASIQLHINHGFREVGRRERIGKMHGRWRDVILFERRSDRVGI
ncbi:GNAT family N-acetyltransferase [Salsuginibacillus kocurii]|uniref:GNAT family N-acetyltransferase n=1 Tax=Salsuginibacillus kocurii TaxID=427078 RepID=UPI00036D1022|nr:GNAT family N-acetyltransferase [Salsuginibacillus kocurii]